MEILCTLCLSLGAVSLALAYVGFGPAWLLAPVSLARWRLLLAPILGCAVISVAFSIGAGAWLSAGQLTLGVLILATALNAVALVLDRPWPRVQLTTGHLGPALVLLASLAAALAPLVSYGFVTIVGVNGDVEIYLSTAECLLRHPAASIATAPPNPLRDLASTTANGALSDMGFSYVLSFMAAITGKPSVQLFAVLIAVLLALNAAAVYVFARAPLALSVAPAALVGLATALNALIVWSGLFNYGRQVAALPLLPVTGLALWACLMAPTWRSVAFASLMFAAIGITYWPAALWASLCAGLLVVLSVALPGWRRWLRTAALTLCLGAGAFVALLGQRLPSVASGFLSSLAAGQPVSSNPLPTDFLPLTHLYGLAYYIWPEPLPTSQWLGPSLGPAVEAAAPAVAIVCGLLGALGLWRAVVRRELLPVALVLGSAAFLGVTQLGLNDRYSHFKAVTFAVFVATVLAVSGLVLSWGAVGRLGSRLARAGGRAALTTFAVAWLAMAASNVYFTLDHFIRWPESPYVSPYTDIAKLNKLVDPAASVWLTSDAELQHGVMGAICYSLLGHPLYGAVSTAHVREWDNRVWLEPGKDGWFTVEGAVGKEARQPLLCDYGVFAADEDPVDQGYAGELVWGNEAIKVYSRGASLARLELGADAGGAKVTAERPLELRIAQPSDGARSGESGYGLVVQVGVLVEQKVVVEVDGERREQRLTPGLWRIGVPLGGLPARVKVVGEGDEGVVVDWVHLMAGRLEGVERLEDRVLVGVQVQRGEEQVVSSMEWVGPQPEKEPSWLELRVRDLDSGQVGSPIGAWRLEGTVQEAEARLRLSDGVIEVGRDGERLEGVSWRPERSEGRYAVEVGVVMAGDLGDRGAYRRVMELERFAVRGGGVQVEGKEERYAHCYLSMELWEPVEARFGDEIRLLGYTAGGREVKVGERVKVSLYWEVPRGLAREWRVLTEVVDGGGREWGQRDESLKSALSYEGERSEVEVLRTDYEVVVDEMAPEGDYELRLRMYSPVTMQMLPVVVGGEVERGAVELTGFRVER